MGGDVQIALVFTERHLINMSVQGLNLEAHMQIMPLSSQSSFARFWKTLQQA